MTDQEISLRRKHGQIYSLRTQKQKEEKEFVLGFIEIVCDYHGDIIKKKVEAQEYPIPDCTYMILFS